MNNLQAARGVAGDVLNSIDNDHRAVSTRRTWPPRPINRTRKMWTWCSAISDFQNQQNGYDAALKSYAMVQHLSLFQYVNGG